MDANYLKAVKKAMWGEKKNLAINTMTRAVPVKTKQGEKKPTTKELMEDHDG